MPRPAPQRVQRCHPAEAQAAIEAFLAATRLPVLQEPGQLPFPLTPGSFHLSIAANALTISAWDDARQLHRRIIHVAPPDRGRLALTIEKFGGRHETVTLYDDARPQSLTLRKQADRHCFRELLRGIVKRQFPGWTLKELSADQDLEHSLSANYPRGLLSRGASQRIAFIGAAEGPAEPVHVLTYGLIWLDYLRRKHQSVDTLALFLPKSALTATALRLRWLQNARFLVFVIDAAGLCTPVDPADCGNLHTELHPPPVEKETIHGLEIPEPEAKAEMQRMRNADALDKRNPLYTSRPEAWLQSLLQADIQSIDATLLQSPIYGQVISIAGLDRGIADLLAIDHSGRLAVIEIKAGEDIHLPLQALDYWMRIQHHLPDFERRGYYQNVHHLAPRLLLVAPAFAFHATTETILRFFSSNIQVERIGLALEWRHRLQVLFRLRGAESPA